MRIARCSKRVRYERTGCMSDLSASIEVKLS
jgi:hypothetical protein